MCMSNRILHLKYKVFHWLLADLGWVGFDLGSFTICLILLRQMGFGKKLG